MGQRASYVFQEVLSRVSHLTKEADEAAVQSRYSDATARIGFVANLLHIERFIAMHGDLPADKIKRKHVRAYRDMLAKFPRAQPDELGGNRRSRDERRLRRYQNTRPLQ